MSASSVPVYKVGLVVVSHAHGDDPKVLLLKVKPDPKKPNYNPDEPTPWVLPRGSRAYLKPGAPKDSTRAQDWQDVRNDADAVTYAKRLEPVAKTLIREAGEETGLSEASLRKASLYDMGVRPYARDGKTTNIHWFVCDADEPVIREIRESQPVDAEKNLWVSLTTMKEWVEKGWSRQGYLDIAKEAIAGLRNASLPSFELPAPGKSR